MAETYQIFPGSMVEVMLNMSPACVGLSMLRLEGWGDPGPGPALGQR